jgi:exodeoxyribonuclease-3
MKKVISYNVNGIRAALSKGFADWLKTENPDIVCIQETKAQPEQIESELFEKLGYKYYWFSAQKKGYSGVGILTKTEPDNMVYGMNIKKYDDEGRFLRADFGEVSVISVYHPSGSSGDERQAFKMQWLSDFTDYIQELKNHRKKLIISGDYNICRLWIDIHNPLKQEDLSGFLPEERNWFQSFIDLGFTDSFRKIYPEKKDQYSWWSYRGGARLQNKGWRIDYHITNIEFSDSIKDAFILPGVKHSDHCPVGIVIDF